MKITEESLVSEIVVFDYRTSSIFDEYGIDYCFRGGRSLIDICHNRAIEPDELIMNLNTMIGMQSNHIEAYKLWSLEELVNHIEEKHHSYFEQRSREIRILLDYICQIYGTGCPELHNVKHLFQESNDQLTRHIEWEELNVFPFIKKLIKSKNGEIDFDTPSFDSIMIPIRQMKKDHNQIIERFRKIRVLTKNLQIPSDACSNYISAYKLIEEFENDLHLYIHLEHNILFPRSIKIETELNYE